MSEPRSILEQPIRRSRWSRLRAWWYGYQLPRTPLEAMRAHKQGMADAALYGTKKAET